MIARLLPTSHLVVDTSTDQMSGDRRDDDGVLGRRHVEPDHVGGLGDGFRVVALAPRFAPGEVDLLGAESARHTEHRRRRAPPPAAARSSVHNSRVAADPTGQDALARRGRVFDLGSPGCRSRRAALSRWKSTREPRSGSPDPNTAGNRSERRHSLDAEGVLGNRCQEWPAHRLGRHRYPLAVIPV